MTSQNDQSQDLRLVIVDDHEFAREAVAQSLETQDGVTVVGQAGSVAVARAEIERLQPDVAVLDLNLPDGTGADLVEYFTRTAPDLRCVVYTSQVSVDDAESLLDAGAAAVVLKTLRGTDLIDAIRGSSVSASSNGESSFSPWGEA